MTDRAAQPANTDNQSNAIRLTLVVNGERYQAEAAPQDIFHEVLEHAVPAALLKGHRIRISTPGGDEIFPDMFISETAVHFKTTTFQVEARPLSDVTAGAQTATWTNLGFDHLAVTVADRADAKEVARFTGT